MGKYSHFATVPIPVLDEHYNTRGHMSLVLRRIGTEIHAFLGYDRVDILKLEQAERMKAGLGNAYVDFIDCRYHPTGYNRANGVVKTNGRNHRR